MCLGGRAVTGPFVQGLLDAACSPQVSDPTTMRLRTLTLHGIKLSSVNWMQALRAPPGSFGAGTGAGAGRWSLRCSQRGEPIFLSALKQLVLVDCVDHGAMLPYLSLLPALEELQLVCTRASWRDPAHGVAAGPGRDSEPPAVRTLDFLSLAACENLRDLGCDYAVRPSPNPNHGDEHLADQQAAHRLRQRMRSKTAASRAASASASAAAAAATSEPICIILQGKEVPQENELEEPKVMPKAA